MTLKEWWATFNLGQLDRILLLTDQNQIRCDMAESVVTVGTFHEVFVYDMKPRLFTLVQKNHHEHANPEWLLEVCSSNLGRVKPINKAFGQNPFLAERMAKNMYSSDRAPLMIDLLRDSLGLETTLERHGS